MKKKKKKNRILKCVKVFSVKLDIETFQNIDDLFQKYGKCKNDFFQQYSGIKSILKVEHYEIIRNNIRKENKSNYLKEKYGFQGRHWVMSLFDACTNIKSAWSNLANKLKEEIKENGNFTNDEKSYLHYIVSVRELWYQLLNDEVLTIKKMKTFNKLRENVSDERIHYLHNYLKRITRKYKFNIPHSDITNCILLDEIMYQIIEDGDDTYISFTSDIRNKSFVVKLKSKYCYDKKGNIQLVLNRRKRCIEIHKLIESRTRNHSGLAIIGVDKGYTNLLSCSDGKEYGIDMGKQFTKTSDYTNKRNTNRNYFIQLHKNLKIELEELEKQIKEETNEQKKIFMLIQRIKLYKKIAHIEEHHLGNNLYQKQYKRHIATLERDTNFYIKKMFEESHVHFFCKEDLSFTGNKNKGKKCNKILNSWLKGTLNARMEYLASYYRIAFMDVNAAYTSKYCNECGTKITRKGEHHEIADCPNCGKMDANINAAKNILDRKNDSEITLYTPYKKVEQILEKRYIDKTQKN